MDAFRKKQEEMRRLREQGESNQTAAAGAAPVVDVQQPSSAADRFRSLRRERSGGMNNDVDTISSSSTSQPTESLSSSTSTTSSSSSSSSIQNQNQNQHSDSSTNGDASAASYFLKKKAERSGSVPMAPLTLKTDCTPEQYKAMYERAVKDNQLLVKKYNERSAECKKLKDELKKTPAVRESARTSRVISREQRVSMAMSTQLGGQLGNLLSLVQNLDEQIKASESARQYAEEKLIEMALQKIDVTEALKKVDDALEKVATRMRGGGNVDKELVANIITKIRKDILGADVDDAPAASAHPDAAAAATATAAAAAAAQKPLARRSARADSHRRPALARRRREAQGGTLQRSHSNGASERAHDAVARADAARRARNAPVRDESRRSHTGRARRRLGVKKQAQFHF
jgi:hypothetical protein